MTEVIAYRAGAEAPIGENALMAKLEAARQHLAAPFAPERVELVASVAETLLGPKRPAASGPIAHFAFWTRRAALMKLAASFKARIPENTLARPRGLVFHLPPQNVETIFLYSWALAYLAGNANIVRLPNEISAAMRAIVDLFLARLEAQGEPSQSFVHYPSESDLGAKISALSDARVVWGGDAKVALFAPLPLRNGGKAIWFGDRFSFSTIRGAALGELDDKALRALAKRLHNDVFVFDQMACSSPHALYVVGAAEAHWPAVKRLLDASALEWTMDDPKAHVGHAIGKMTAAFYAAATGRASSANWQNTNLTSVVASAPERQEIRVGGGFLSVVFIPSLAEVTSFIRESDQTITYFGWERGEIEKVAASRAGPGVARWAPIGTALDFDFIWDGYDIPFELTRLVRIS
ncbi:MAG TPA: acyl-CoA reductase [Roseiarcus sp.]|nr:acyl-CoA reductase [Roseiarcus sp.]